VFGLSFGELCVLLVVAMVVLGPKELPRYLRKAGQFAGRMRRLAFEMREKSGIDEVLRTEGIDRDIAEIRRLTRGEIGGVMAAVRSTTDAMRIGNPATIGAVTGPGSAGTAAVPGAVPAPAPTLPAYPPLYAPGGGADAAATRMREYPSEGADAYGALPDTAPVYDGSFPASPLAENPLYARGDDAAEAPAATPDESAPARAAAGTAE
jgi:sec-independent protein translocase protein TatB